LSEFKPISVIKRNKDAGNGGILVRIGLVTVQFAISIILIVGVLVTYNQLQYVRTKDLGYRPDNILYFNNEFQTGHSREAFLADIKRVPGVENASSIWGTLLGCNECSTGDISWEGKQSTKKRVHFEMLRVDYGLIEMLNIQFREGRPFLKSDGEDRKIIFNEAAINLMGIKNPVGKSILYGGKKMEIIGVTKNFHFKSLHETVKPLFIELQPDRTNSVMVKLKHGSEGDAINSIASIYKKFQHGSTFDYKFLNATNQNLYQDEKRAAFLTNFFAIVALLLSCLGLFGLTAFTAERRRKEISIRKILGSGNLKIIQLLLGDFTAIMLLSILLGLPFSYLFAREWLNGFAYRIDLSWWYFIVAGVIALLIAWITVISQAIKSASSNPVINLRVED
jgi:hypothetical protein